MITFFVYLIVGIILCFFILAAGTGLLILLYLIGLPVAGILKIFSRKS